MLGRLSSEGSCSKTTISAKRKERGKKKKEKEKFLKEKTRIRVNKSFLYVGTERSQKHVGEERIETKCHTRKKRLRRGHKKTKDK